MQCGGHTHTMSPGVGGVDLVLRLRHGRYLPVLHEAAGEHHVHLIDVEAVVLDEVTVLVDLSVQLAAGHMEGGALAQFCQPYSGSSIHSMPISSKARHTFRAFFRSHLATARLPVKNQP